MSLLLLVHAAWVKPEDMESFELGYEVKKTGACPKGKHKVGYCACVNRSEALALINLGCCSVPICIAGPEL